MFNKCPKPQVCVISGDPIKNVGSLDDYNRRRDRFDGVHTEIGTISRRLVSVYERAIDEAYLSLDASPKSLRKFVSRKVKDADFARSVLREETKNNVFNVLAGDVTDDYKDSTKIVRELRDLFIQDVDVRAYADKDDGKEGLALKRALGCMSDDVRTMKFCDSLLRAVGDKEQEKDEIELVDAGTGPIPLFGVLAALKSDKVKATCLEFNPQSAAMARQIIENVGLSDRVKVVCTDAKKYKHDKEIDVLISETMFAGLTNGEEMIQILENLALQVEENGEVIPKSITVEAGITEFGSGAVAELSLPLRQVCKFEMGDESEKIEFSMPLDGLEPYTPYELVLASEVILDEDVILERHESEITRPTRIGIVGFVLDEDGPSKTLHVSYKPGAEEYDVRMEIC